MQKVFLINPPSSFENSPEESNLRSYRVGSVKTGVWPPLGLMYIAAELQKNEISVGILDAFAKEYSLSKTIETIRREQPRIVGISAATPQIRGAYQLASEIKNRFGSEMLVCLGGPHVSSDPEFMDRVDCFDFAVLGEAEVDFPGIVKHLLNGGVPERIYRSTPPKNLDVLPMPDRSVFDINDYFKTEQPCFTIITSRGCPYKCIFCSRAAITDKVRYRSPESVLDEIGQCMEKWGRTLVFLDDTFGMSRPHAIRILEGIIDRGYDLRWTCNTRAHLIDRDFIDLMKRSGCYMLLFGVESGSEHLRNEILKKHVADAAIKNAVSLCKEFDILSGLYFMLGFPGETRQDMEKTVTMGRDLRADLITVHPTAIYPGSQLQKTLQEKRGIDINTYWTEYAKGDLSFEDIPSVYIPEEMDLQYIQKARKRAYRKFYFRPSVIWAHLKNDIASWKDLKRDAVIAINLFLKGKTSKDLK